MGPGIGAEMCALGRSSGRHGIHRRSGATCWTDVNMQNGDIMAACAARGLSAPPDPSRPGQNAKPARVDPTRLPAAWARVRENRASLALSAFRSHLDEPLSEASPPSLMKTPLESAL